MDNVNRPAQTYSQLVIVKSIAKRFPASYSTVVMKN